MASRLGETPPLLGTPGTHEKAGQSASGGGASFGEGESGKMYIYPYSRRADNVPVWEFMQLSYRGGREFKDGVDAEGNEIFQKHKKEDTAEALSRKGRSSVLNYSRFFVERFSGYVQHQDPARSDSKDVAWREFLADATGRGTTFDALVKRWQSKCLIRSPYWMRIDPPREDLRVRTAADAKKFGFRPVASLVAPENIFDYERDPDTGEMRRLVVRDIRRTKPDVSSPEQEETLFTEWTTTTWRKLRQVSGSPASVDQKVEVEPVGGVEMHSLGVVPLIPLHFTDPEADNSVFSESRIHDVAAWQRDIFRIFSLLLEEWFNRTFSTTVITGVRPEEIASQMGSLLLAVQNPAASVYPTGADTDQAKSLLDGLHFLIRNLFRAAQFESSGDPKESRTAESGEKRQRDLEGLYQVLATFASATAAAENRLIRIWAVAAGKESIADNLAVTAHPQDFSVQTIEADLAALGDMILNEFPRTFVAEEMKTIMRRKRPNMPASVWAVIESEIAEFVATEPEEPATP